MIRNVWCSLSQDFDFLTHTIFKRVGLREFQSCRIVTHISFERVRYKEQKHMAGFLIYAILIMLYAIYNDILFKNICRKKILVQPKYFLPRRKILISGHVFLFHTPNPFKWYVSQDCRFETHGDCLSVVNCVKMGKMRKIKRNGKKSFSNFSLSPYPA